MASEVKVARLPKCDFCDQPASYDAKTHYGSWANMCQRHYDAHAMYPNKLGTGRGQKLVLDNERSE